MTSRDDPDAPAGRLRSAPHAFSFFQAVRMLERIAHEEGGPGAPVGEDAPPRREVVRLRANPSLAFPAGEVASLVPGTPGDPEAQGSAREPDPPRMNVSFLGSTGPAGVLPDHYTELLLQRVRQKDRAFADLLGMFDHRALSFFHRAWAKYRLPIAWESAAIRRRGDDPVTAALVAISGHGTPSDRNRLRVDDELFIRHAGALGRPGRPAVMLEAMLNEHFGLPFTVVQFAGDWIRLDPGDRSCLGTETERRGRHACLGRDVVLGSRTFDVVHRFVVRVGPLRWPEFREFMPTGSLLGPVCDAVRSWAGPEFTFAVMPVLRPHESPPLVLGAEAPDAPRLGWNTWTETRPVPHEFSGVTFAAETLLIEPPSPQHAR